MRNRLSKVLVVAVAAALALGAFDAASARHKKPRHHQPQGEPGIARDYDGTPIIMKGYHAPRVRQDEEPPKERAERPPRAPRGSSTYIPAPVPSRTGGPPAAVLVQPPPKPYVPPPVNTFGDRVTNCIHSYSLNAGIGNNPTDRQSYIRQCAN